VDPQHFIRSMSSKPIIKDDETGIVHKRRPFQALGLRVALLGALKVSIPKRNWALEFDLLQNSSLRLDSLGSTKL
jgi:hypothetical protein